MTTWDSRPPAHRAETCWQFGARRHIIEWSEWELRGRTRPRHFRFVLLAHDVVGAMEASRSTLRFRTIVCSVVAAVASVLAPAVGTVGAQGTSTSTVVIVGVSDSQTGEAL